MSRAIIILNKYNYTPIRQKIVNDPSSKFSELIIIAEGGSYHKDLSEDLNSIDGVHSLVRIEKDKARRQTISESVGTLTKKKQCKSLMTQIFGAKVAASVDQMNESNCVSLCHAKALGLVGIEGAKVFKDIA